MLFCSFQGPNFGAKGLWRWPLVQVSAGKSFLRFRAKTPSATYCSALHFGLDPLALVLTIGCIGAYGGVVLFALVLDMGWCFALPKKTKN